MPGKSTEAGILFIKYAKDIFRYSFSILKNEDEAKDAVQEVFKKYVESKETFDGRCSHKTWLVIIARNYCFNRIRKRGFKHYSIDQTIMDKKYEPDLDDIISLEYALMKLSPDESELIFLREYESYSYKELAEITGQSVNNVKVKLHRIRNKLREILK